MMTFIWGLAIFEAVFILAATAAIVTAPHMEDGRE